MKLSVKQNEHGLWLEAGAGDWSFPLPRGVTAIVEGGTVQLESPHPIFLADPKSVAAIAVRHIEGRLVLLYSWPTRELQLAAPTRSVTRHAHKAGWILPATVKLIISTHRVSSGLSTTSSLTITTDRHLDTLVARAQLLVARGQNTLSRSHLPTRQV